MKDGLALSFYFMGFVLVGIITGKWTLFVSSNTPYRLPARSSAAIVKSIAVSPLCGSGSTRVIAP